MTDRVVTVGDDLTLPASVVVPPSRVTGTAVVEGDDRLSDARTPTAHKTSHATGAADALAPADIGAATAAQGGKADSASQPGHGHTAAAITDSTAAGRALLTAADAKAQRAALAVGGLAPTPLSGVVVTALDLTAPRAVAEFGGYLWGVNATGTISRSVDDGTTWAAVTTIAGSPFVRLLIPTSDGEVLAVANLAIYKSSGWAGASPTWALKQAPAGTCNFLNWSIAGDGTRLLTTEYSSTNRADSRYARMSFDAGNTWQVVYDSVAVHGQTLGDGSHLHGCAYDPWADRWYISEGHDDGGTPGQIAGIYCSTDDGATWARAAGMAQNPGPTMLVPTPDGLVCGSDYAENGVYGVQRMDSPAAESLTAVWRWRPGRAGLVGFANSGRLDPTTGLVYMTWTTAFSDVAPIITAATVTTGDVVYTWPTLPVTNSDGISSVHVSGSGRLTAEVRAAPLSYSLSGRTGAPGAGRDVSLSDRSAILGGTATNGDSVAVGKSASTAASLRGAAVGQKASATGDDGTAVGYSAASAGSATAVGASSVAGTLSTAVGKGATTTTLTECVAVGASASTTGGAAVAVGRSATSAAGGVALGGSSSAAPNGVALGAGAVATAGLTYGVALGRASVTTGNNQVQIMDRHIEIKEVADPPAPAANAARLYVRDNGAGKTELCARFATGAVLVIATEP